MSFPIKGFLETSFVDWPGKIASVIFLPHCNFRCPYCHNYDLVLAPHQFTTVSLTHVLTQIKKGRGWINGVCITGGEPTLLPNLIPLIERLKGEQLLVKIDTNGSQPEMLAQLIDARLVDYVAMDVKAPLNHESYARCSGVTVDLEKVKRSIGLLQENFLCSEFRVTAVPTLLSREDLMELACELRGATKLTLQNFNPVHTLDPSLRAIKPYTIQEIKEMQEEMDCLLGRETRTHDMNSLPFCA